MNNNRSHYKGNPTIFRTSKVESSFYWYRGWRSNDKLYSLSEDLYVDLSSDTKIHSTFQQYLYLHILILSGPATIQRGFKLSIIYNSILTSTAHAVLINNPITMYNSRKDRHYEEILNYKSPDPLQTVFYVN